MTDFFKKIGNSNNLTDDSYLVSFDVWCLYTNTAHTEVVEAVRESLQKVK